MPCSSTMLPMSLRPRPERHAQQIRLPLEGGIAIDELPIQAETRRAFLGQRVLDRADERQPESRPAASRIRPDFPNQSAPAPPHDTPIPDPLGRRDDMQLGARSRLASAVEEMTRALGAYRQIKRRR